MTIMVDKTKSNHSLGTRIARVLFILAFSLILLGLLFVIPQTQNYLIKTTTNHILSEQGIVLMQYKKLHFHSDHISLDDAEFSILPENHYITIDKLRIGYSLKGKINQIILDHPHIHLSTTSITTQLDFYDIHKSVYNLFQELKTLSEFKIYDGVLYATPLNPFFFNGELIHRENNKGDRLLFNLSPSVISSTPTPQDLPSEAKVMIQQSQKGFSLKLSSPHYHIIYPNFTATFKDLSLKIINPSTVPDDIPISVPFTITSKGTLESLNISDISSLKKPLYFQTEMTPETTRMVFSIKFGLSSQISDPLLNLSGFYQLFLDQEKGKELPLNSLANENKNKLEATITSQDLKIVDLFDFTPIFGDDLKIISGTTKLNGVLKGDLYPVTPGIDGILSGILPEITCQLKNINLKGKSISIQNAASSFVINQLFPFSTPLKQSFTISQIQLKDILLDTIKGYFHFSPKQGFTPQSIAFNGAGGSFNIFNIDWKSTPLHSQFEANINDIKLEEISKILKDPTFKASGKLSGSGAFTYQQGEIDIKNLSLINQDPGNINYTSPTEGLEGEAKMALQALNNFKYNALKIDLHAASNDKNDLNGSILLKGNNPNILNGYPFEFNIETTGQLRDVIQSVILGLSHPKNKDDLKKLIP